MPKTNSGGKRPGAGRPSGLPIRNRSKPLALVPGPEKLPVGFLAKPEQETAALMVAKGFSFAEVCRRLEINPSTLQEWRKKDFWPLALEKAKHELAGDPNVALRPLTPRAVGVYDKTIEGYLDGDTEPGLAVSVSRDIMDRVWGKPLIRTQSQSRKDIRILIQEIGADDIIEWDSHTADDSSDS